MSSDFESYEQDFAVLTAEITGRIGKVPKLVGDEKKQMVANVEKQLEEARELLEQMELEVREIPPQSRGMYSSRMRSYKQEMGKLEADFQSTLQLLHAPVQKIKLLLRPPSKAAFSPATSIFAPKDARITSAVLSASVRSLPRNQILELLEVRHTATPFDQLQRVRFELQ